MDLLGNKRRKEKEQALEQREKELNARIEKYDAKQAESEKKLLEYSGKLETLRKQEIELNTWSDKLNGLERDLKNKEETLLAKETSLNDKERALTEKEKAAAARKEALETRAAELEEKSGTLKMRSEELNALKEGLDRLKTELELKETELTEREAALAREKIAEVAENPGDIPPQASNPDNAPAELNPLLGNVDTSIPNEIKKKKVDEYNKIIQLPNAMVGKLYELELDQLNLGDDMIIDQIIGLEAFNLAYIKSEYKIVGTPDKDGEDTFQVVYRLESQGLEELTDKKMRLLVNPDPRSLWKDLAPPEDGLFYKNNEDHDRLDYDDLKVVAASKRGRSHAHSGTFRDDHFLIESLDSGWLFAAVADGAGSAEYSREGSRIACEKSREIVASMLEKDRSKLEAIIVQHIENPNSGDIKQTLHTELYQIFGQGVMAARNSIIEKAKEHEHQVRDYSTTLIFAIMKKIEQSYFIASYAVGDGAAVIHKDGERVKLLMEPDGGEYAGQTRFLTMAEVMESQDIWKRIRFDLNHDFTTIFLMTDGVSDPKFQTDANLQKTELWDSMMEDIRQNVDFQSPESGEQLVNWLDFWSQGNHDDRTIAIITKT